MSAPGFLVRFLLGLAVSLIALSSIVGFAVGHSHAHSGVLGAGLDAGAWASPAELAWLGRLGRWDLQLRRGLEAAAARSEPRRLEQSVGRDGSCSGSLERTVGSPPTARLGHAYAMFFAACSHLRRFGDALSAWEANSEARRAAQLLSKADQLLPPGEVRALPAIAGATGASRDEPRFGLVASRLAGKPIEARCWSGRDWSHLIQEERAYTDGQLGDGTLAFASIGGNRINLGPAVCDSLADLAYRHLRPSSAKARMKLATAVVTLSHEPQHSRGVVVEATAECTAIQLASRTAVRLGADVSYAATLVRTYWQHYADELPAYRSPECRKGGALDLGHADSIWP